MHPKKVFDQIRNIPYSIPLSKDAVNNSCSGKAMRLKNDLEKFGFNLRYRVVDFKWSDLPLPDEILQIPHRDITKHVYLEFQNNESIWVNIDPTWDNQLQHIFCIAEWDSKNGTPIAVEAINTYSIEESEKIINNPNLIDLEEEFRKSYRFFCALNEWLDKCRS